jgi:hypothetical protein
MSKSHGSRQKREGEREQEEAVLLGQFYKDRLQVKTE